MGLEGKNKRRFPSRSCTAWKVEWKKMVGINVVVKKRGLVWRLLKDYCRRDGLQRCFPGVPIHRFMHL